MGVVEKSKMLPGDISVQKTTYSWVLRSSGLHQRLFACPHRPFSRASTPEQYFDDLGMTLGRSRCWRFTSHIAVVKFWSARCARAYSTGFRILQEGGIVGNTKRVVPHLRRKGWTGRRRNCHRFLHIQRETSGQEKCATSLISVSVLFSLHRKRVWKRFRSFYQRNRL